MRRKNEKKEDEYQLGVRVTIEKLTDINKEINVMLDEWNEDSTIYQDIE